MLREKPRVGSVETVSSKELRHSLVVRRAQRREALRIKAARKLSRVLADAESLLRELGLLPFELEARLESYIGAFSLGMTMLTANASEITILAAP